RMTGGSPARRSMAGSSRRLSIPGSVCPLNTPDEPARAQTADANDPITDCIRTEARPRDWRTRRMSGPEILDRCERLAVDSHPYLYARRIGTKVAGVNVQNGYQLYRTSFAIDRSIGV